MHTPWHMKNERRKKLTKDQGHASQTSVEVGNMAIHRRLSAPLQLFPHEAEFT